MKNKGVTTFVRYGITYQGKITKVLSGEAFLKTKFNGEQDSPATLGFGVRSQANPAEVFKPGDLVIFEIQPSRTDKLRLKNVKKL